jgi:uncharacterized protein YjiS (DUF1127 family)
MTIYSGMQTKVRPLLRGARQPLARSLIPHILLAVSVTLHRWQSRAVQRRALAGMSDYHLKDIGLSRADVEGEAAKHFWRE